MSKFGFAFHVGATSLPWSKFLSEFLSPLVWQPSRAELVTIEQQTDQSCQYIQMRQVHQLEEEKRERKKSNLIFLNLAGKIRPL